MTEFHFYDQIVFHCVYVLHFFICSSVYKHWGCSHSMATVTNVTTNMGMQMSLWHTHFISGSHGGAIFSFKNLKTQIFLFVFHVHQCVCAYSHVCRHTNMCDHVEFWVYVGNLPWLLLTLFIKAGSFRLTQSSTGLVWLTSLLWEIGFVSPPPKHWDYRWPPHPPSVYVGSGNLNSSLHVVWQVL